MGKGGEPYMGELDNPLETMFGLSSFQTWVIPALVSFKQVFFFHFGRIFKCHTHRIEKIPFGFLDAEFYAKSLKKNH